MAAAFASALLLAACVTTGDFGRRKGIAPDEKIGIEIAPDRIGSAHALNDDEVELRHRAALYLQPPRASHWPAFAWTESLVATDFDVYFSRLAGEPDASPVARYHRLQADIEGDAAGLPDFRMVACRVIAADHARHRLLTSGKSELGDPDRRDTDQILVRMAANAALVTSVEDHAAARHALYKAALKRLRLASPDDENAADVADSLDALGRIIARRPPCPN